jgi:hypothetical protein
MSKKMIDVRERERDHVDGGVGPGNGGDGI